MLACPPLDPLPRTLAVAPLAPSGRHQAQMTERAQGAYGVLTLSFMGTMAWPVPADGCGVERESRVER